jgi:hypothetical protein
MLTRRPFSRNRQSSARAPGGFAFQDSVTPVTLSLCAALMLGIGTPVSAQPTERIPRIGLAGDDLDACLSVGQVTGLNPRGENFLAVRAEPKAGAREKDRLGPGRWLWLCDEDGEWIGVVYSDDPHEEPGDCGVGSPVESVRPYDGECRYGWVHSRYVTVIAG